MAGRLEAVRLRGWKAFSCQADEVKPVPWLGWTPTGTPRPPNTETSTCFDTYMSFHSRSQQKYRNFKILNRTARPNL